MHIQNDEATEATRTDQGMQFDRYDPSVRRINKHVFVWVCNFLFGTLGVDRFIRGQIGLGIIKLLTGGAIGVWALVDFIVALVKCYDAGFGGSENVVFINGKYAR